jgi:dTDP-4-dehydrorhamnose 3,5-epimerase
MQAAPTLIADVLIFEPKVFGDARGFFMESFNQKAFDAALAHAAGQAAGNVAEPEVRFVQDNHSRSARGVLRGLHYQLPPHAQGKLVRVTQGCVFDVAVDIRPASPTFGRWVGTELSDANHRQMWIPPGLAHGFLVLSDSADFLYKTTDYYAPQAERSLRWDDPALAIAWPDSGVPVVLSAKDAAAPGLDGLVG